jgi:S1-C subfamily serine protease
MKKLAIVALLLFAVNCWAQNKTISVKTVTSLSRTIVPIVCGYNDERNNFKVAFPAGSGFFVDTYGRFITANHVFEGWDKATEKTHACSPSIYIPDQGWRKFTHDIKFQYFTFVTCDRDPAVDLAVCTLEENPFTSKRVPRQNISIATFDTAEYLPGTTVAFMGFPLGYTVPINSIGNIAGLMGIPSSATGYAYVIDKSNWPGASGSPIFLPSGKVIGIVQQRGVNEGSGLSYGMSATVVVDFLGRHPHIETQPEKKSEKK